VELIDREVPAPLRATALYAASGLTQEQSAILQGVTDRTVRNRLRDLRNYLDPPVTLWEVIRVALESFLDKPAKRDGQPVAPLLADALAE
jgi:hypothetical protein